MAGEGDGNGPDYPGMRAQMVARQLRARGVTSARVLEAMAEVPRHRFVPEAQQYRAYDDRPLPIGEGQTISQPYMVAIMTEALDPQPPDAVLEVGTGSGYQAAILARLARTVITVERHPPLADQARRTLADLGIRNVTVLVGDGTAGAPEFPPFQRILVTAGAPRVPEALRRQLADGGRLVIPVGSPTEQQLLLVDRRGERFEEAMREGCVFVPLIGREGWPDR